MTQTPRTLESTVIRFTWSWALIFLPIETYLSFREGPISVSGYVVNVAYAEGLLATGWTWTTAVFWRATNLRYWLAGDGEPLSFGSVELWLAPMFTIMAGAALAGSLVLLLKNDRQAEH